MNVPTVLRIPVLPFGMVNAHLIVGNRGAVLVDAGLPGSTEKVVRVLKAAGLAPRDVRLIVVTHAHVDHAGEAAALRELTGAPIMAHEADAAHFAGERPMTFCSTGWFGSVFRHTGLIQRAYPPFVPDILLTEGELRPLDDFGVAGSVRHTPGHTAGSVSVTAGDCALVGDMAASGIGLGGIVRVGTAKSPPFEEDPVRVAAELDALLEQGAQTFYLGHGGPLSAREVARHAANLRRRAPRALLPA